MIGSGGGLIGSGRERCRGVRDLESERMEAGERVPCEREGSGRERCRGVRDLQSERMEVGERVPCERESLIGSGGEWCRERYGSARDSERLEERENGSGRGWEQGETMSGEELM